MSLALIWNCYTSDVERLTPFWSKSQPVKILIRDPYILDLVYYLKGRDYVEQRPRTTLGHGEFQYGPVNPKEEKYYTILQAVLLISFRVLFRPFS